MAGVASYPGHVGGGKKLLLCDQGMRLTAGGESLELWCAMLCICEI